MVELRSLRTVYVEVPKAASKSVNRALRDELRDRLTTRGEPANQSDVRFTRKWWTPQIMDTAAFDARGWEDHLVFTVVRHPVERFESLFYQRVNTGDIDDFALGFADTDWVTDPHGMRQRELIGTDLGRYDYVGRVEDMAAVAGVLSVHLGHTVTIGHANASVRGPHLRGAGLTAVIEHYREDFELLGYEQGEAGQA